MDSGRFRWIAISIIAILGLIGSITMGVLYTQTSDKLNTAHSDITALQSQVSNLSTSNITLGNQLSGLEGEVDTLTAETEALQVQARAVVDSIATIYPSVVYIYAELPGDSPGQTFTVTGSGVILSPDGYILTNKHVVGGAIYAEVITQDMRIYIVEDIFLDDILDLAVVKINGQNLPAASIGDAENLKVGDVVMALGHPLGISPEEGGATVTSGIVSNLGRSFWIEDDPYYDVIQTDAAISPGNSGGPLINTNGEVIGINSAGISEGQNLNFAISMATAGHVFEDLVAFGQVHHPYLGILIDDNIEFFPGGDIQIYGALVTEVELGSPAALGGLRTGDVITSFEGDAVHSAADLVKLLWRNHSGNTITLTVQRGSIEITTSVLLVERSENSDYL